MATKRRGSLAVADLKGKGCGNLAAGPSDAQRLAARVDAAPAKKRGRGRPRKEIVDQKQATTLRLPPDYLRRLRIAAAIRGTTSVAIIQQAIDGWFERNPLPAGVLVGD